MLLTVPSGLDGSLDKCFYLDSRDVGTFYHSLTLPRMLERSIFLDVRFPF